MRYSTDSFGENPHVLARFQSGRASGSVTVAVYDLSDDSDITPGGSAALEIGSTGIYKWDSEALSPAPIDYTEILVIFSDSVTGRKADQKIVLGGFTDDSALNEYGGRVTIDPISGSAGTDYPIGTPTSPVDNITDARTIADEIGVQEYNIRGHVIMTSDHENWSFVGLSSVDYDILDISGHNVYAARFDKLRVSGSVGGTAPKLLTATDCILDSIVGWDGILNNGAIDISLQLDANGEGLFNNARSIHKVTPILGATIDANGANNIQWANCAGILKATGFASPGILQMSSDGTILTLSGNTGGFWSLGGLVNLTSEASDNMLSLYNETYNRAFWGDAPWDENILQHLSNNTTGLALFSASQNTNSGSIASSVWDASTNTHEQAGSFGEKIGKKLLTFIKFIATKDA